MALSYEEMGWLKRACQVMGPLPEKSIVIDVETSGLNPDKDVALQVAMLVVDADRVSFESFTIDWITGQSSSWLLHLSDRLEKTKDTMAAKGIPYLFTADRLKKEGIPPQEAAERISALAQSYGPEYWIAAHNGLMLDLPFTARLCRSFNHMPLDDNRSYVDTMVLERAVQVRPKLLAGDSWSRFSASNRQLGGSKVRCSLGEHCTAKYTLPTRGQHEADRDTAKTAVLLQIYQKGSL